MGQPNNVLNTYMSRADRIQSVLEYFLGEKLPKDWSCEAEDGFFPVQNSKGKISFRQRDILRRVRIGEGSLLLGLENQSSINLTFPWRLMEMDALLYGREIEKIQEKNQVESAAYGPEDDFKYRFREHDRLEPILNLTLYWGRKTWTKPLSLRDMMNLEALPEKLRALAGDYRVHLVCMRSIKEEDLEKMDSDLKYVLGVLLCSRSRKRYEEFIFKNRAYFSRIPRSALDVLDVCTGIKNFRNHLQFVENTETGEEETDLCKALNDIEKHAFKKGQKKGRKQGEKQGERRGEKRGEKRGERRGELNTLCALVSDGILKIELAAAHAKLSEADFCRTLEEYRRQPSRTS